MPDNATVGNGGVLLRPREGVVSWPRLHPRRLIKCGAASERVVFHVIQLEISIALPTTIYSIYASVVIPRETFFVPFNPLNLQSLL